MRCSSATRSVSHCHLRIGNLVAIVGFLIEARDAVIDQRLVAGSFAALPSHGLIAVM